RDGQVGAALPGQDQAGDVLDGVAGDGDDDEAGEGLGDVQRSDGRGEAVDEPVGDERRGCPGETEQPQGEPEREPWPRPAVAGRFGGVGAQVGDDPGQVDDEQADGADGGDRLDVVAGRVVGAEGEAEEHDDEDGDLQQGGGVPGQALGEAHDPVG